MMVSGEAQQRMAFWAVSAVAEKLPADARAFCRTVTWRIVPGLYWEKTGRVLRGNAQPDRRLIILPWETILAPDMQAIAHELAHLWLYETRGAHSERDADNQARAWGFTRPQLERQS